MPGLNQRGPDNQGPMTGRGMGRCTGTRSDGSWMPGPGSAQGPGRGLRGRRWQCRTFWNTGADLAAEAPQARPPIIDELKNRAARLEDELTAVRRQIDDMS